MLVRLFGTRATRTARAAVAARVGGPSRKMGGVGLHHRVGPHFTFASTQNVLASFTAAPSMPSVFFPSSRASDASPSSVRDKEYHELLLRLLEINRERKMVLGLENMHAAAEKLSPIYAPLRNDVRAIHIAGTNGKGTVANKIAMLLEAAGLRVGLYVSPHIETFRERISVDGRPMRRRDVMDLLPPLLDEVARHKIPMTIFEISTLLAFAHFRRSRCDVAVIECGLGGRIDATNVIDSDVAVLTSVGLEHTKFLGPTVEAIALEKCAIARRGRPLVVGPSVPLHAIEAHVSEVIGATIHRVGAPGSASASASASAPATTRTQQQQQQQAAADIDAVNQALAVAATKLFLARWKSDSASSPSKTASASPRSSSSAVSSSSPGVAAARAPAPAPAAAVSSFLASLDSVVASAHHLSSARRLLPEACAPPQVDVAANADAIDAGAAEIGGGSRATSAAAASTAAAAEVATVNIHRALAFRPPCRFETLPLPASMLSLLPPLPPPVRWENAIVALLDVAHNPQALAALSVRLRETFAADLPKWLVFGCSSDKDVEACLSALLLAAPTSSPPSHNSPSAPSSASPHSSPSSPSPSSSPQPQPSTTAFASASAAAGPAQSAPPPPLPRLPFRGVVFASSATSPRAADPRVLAAAAARVLKQHQPEQEQQQVSTAPTVAEGLQAALRQAAAALQHCAEHGSSPSSSSSSSSPSLSSASSSSSSAASSASPPRALLVVAGSFFIMREARAALRGAPLALGRPYNGPASSAASSSVAAPRRHLQDSQEHEPALRKGNEEEDKDNDADDAGRDALPDPVDLNEDTRAASP